jgi:hypothetical protein
MTKRQPTLPSDRDFEALVAHRDAVCVSVYLPVEHGPARPLNALRIDNVLHDCHRQLMRRHVDRQTRSELLVPLERWLRDERCWQDATGGVALFRSTTIDRCYVLPVRLPLHSVVDDRFYVKPLFRLAGSRARFTIVALQLGRVRLYEATPGTIEELDLSGALPESIALASATDDEGAATRSSGEDGSSVSDRAAAATEAAARGSEEPPGKLARFLQIVGDRLAERVADDPAPVVLVGEEPLLSLFRAAGHDLDIVDGAVPISPETMTEQELLAASWPIAQPRVHQQRLAAAERAKRLEGSLLISHDVEEIVVAADEGRLDALFIPEGHSLWGHLDPSEQAVEVLDRKHPDAVDLYDEAAARSVLNGTDVFVVDPSNVPGGATVAATFRD